MSLHGNRRILWNVFCLVEVELCIPCDLHCLIFKHLALCRDLLLEVNDDAFDVGVWCWDRLV